MLLPRAHLLPQGVFCPSSAVWKKKKSPESSLAVKFFIPVMKKSHPAVVHEKVKHREQEQHSVGHILVKG